MATVLLIAPEKARASGVRSILREDGHLVRVVPRVPLWRAEERDVAPDVVIAAIDDSEAVLTSSGRPSRRFPAPLLFVQHEGDVCEDPYLDERLVDRISSPFLAEELLARVDALVRVRKVIRREPTAAVSAERSNELSGSFTSSPREGSRWSGVGKVAAWLGSRVPRHSKPLSPYLEVAARLAAWADRRDAFEPGHAERVTGLCAMIAEGLGMGDHETSTLLRAAMLHDIGKIALPVEVLHQTAPLEESQKRLIRMHPRRGAELLKALDADLDVASTIMCHHERPDGQGYYGMTERSIPRSAQVLAVAEIYDAMTSSRVTKTMSSDQAMGQLHDHRGQTVDADCVDALLDKLRPRPNTIPLSTRR